MKNDYIALVPSLPPDEEPLACFDQDDPQVLMVNRARFEELIRICKLNSMNPGIALNSALDRLLEKIHPEYNIEIGLEAARIETEGYLQVIANNQTRINRLEEQVVLLGGEISE